MEYTRKKKGRKMIDSIIFDLDGTLWDATFVFEEGWNLAIREAGYEIHLTKAKIESLMGLPVEKIADGAFPMLPKEERLPLMRRCFEKEEEILSQKGGILMEGLEEVLKDLKKQYRLFIVSNCQDGYIQVFLKAHHLESYFEGFICAGDSGMSKGQNNLLLMKEKNLKFPVYVGDTRGDQESAIEAGIPFIFAAYGFGEAEGNPAAIHSLRELEKVLEEVKGK